jgi:hypothetical protein
MRIRSIAALAATLLAAAPAAAQQAQTFQSDAGYSVDLPAGWERMPDEALDPARQSDIDFGDGTYEAVFKVGNAPWPRPPIFGIARLDLPREMTLEEFAAEFNGPDARAQAQAGLDDTPSGQAGARVNVPRWDAASRSAWMRVSFKSDGTSPAFGLSAFTLAPSGRAMIVFAYFGAPHTSEERAQAELEAVVRSLRPS